MDIHHGSTIPAFLNKLISLLEDESTNDLIRWGQNGTSFLVCDQGRFAKEVLPNYFKHNNIASFIRQLNMYGFRKLVNVESGGLKVERDETEFCHPYFIRGRLELLEQIKRKISSSKGDEVKVKQGDVSLILNDVKQMKGKQGDMSNKLDAMKRENQALWREVKELRQKHTKQQQIVNRLIEFLLSLVKPARSGLKRKMPLMINHATESPTSNPPKYSRHLAFQPSTSTISDYDLQSLQPSDSEEFETTEHSNGPIISDVTDLISPNEVDENQKESGFVEDHTNENEVEKLAEAFLPEAQSRLLLDKILDAPVVSEPSIDSALTSLPMGIDLEPPETLLEDDAATSDGNPNNQDSANLSTSNKSDDRDMTVALSNAHASSAPVSSVSLSDHLDEVQNNLDYLQTLLSGQNYSFDPDSFVGLFLGAQDESSEDKNLLDTFTEEGESSATSSSVPGSSIIGNELITYNSPPRGLFADLDIPGLEEETDSTNIKSETPF